MPAFIWKTIRAVSLKIRSGLAMAGACQGVNCLNPLWARSPLCSDKCFLCFPAKSDLLKRFYLLSLSLFLLVSAQTTEFGKKRKIPTCQAPPSSSDSFPAVLSLWGLEATLRRVWTRILIISLAGSVDLQ